MWWSRVMQGAGIKILAYGVLCGGLLTDKYLDRPKPMPDTPSKGKYLQVPSMLPSLSL